VDAVRHQLAHGRYPADPLYGDGKAGPRIADVLATAPLSVQKRVAEVLRQAADTIRRM